MKLSRLFVLGTFGLMSLSVSAAEFTLERTMPVPPGTFAATPVAFQADKHYVLYNTGANRYFSQGGAWGTKACSCPEQDYANIMYLTKYIKDGAWDGKTYIFKIYSTVRSTNYSWHECFFDSDVAMFVDRASQANLYWEIEDQGSNVYRLKAADANPEIHGDGLYVGCPNGAVADETNLDGNREYGTVLPMSPKTSENIDWVFYSTDKWDADAALYEKAEALKAVINKAEELGVDVTNAVTVYNNEASTLAQIEAQIAALGQAMEGLSGITGSATNPGDATSLITNPNFDNASSEGWLGTAPGWGASGQSPAWVAEQYNKTFDTYQELVGLPSGVYGLGASNTFRGSWEDYEAGLDAAALLYATVGGNTFTSPFDNMWSVLNAVPMAGKTEFGTSAGENSQADGDMTYYTPNDPSAARLYFEKGYYHNAVVFSTTDYAARIGVKNPAKNGSGDNWSIFDNFSLTYYGNQGAASYKAWLNDAAKLLYASNLMATKGYVSQFEGTYTSANPADAADANAAYETARKSTELKTLRQNVSLWQLWLFKLDNAVQYTTGEYAGLSSANTLDEYIGWDAAEQKNNPTWTNNEIEASIAQIAQMVEAVITEKMQNINVGEDVTDTYIGKDDATFKNGQGGWTKEGNCNFGAGGAEAYNQKFDLYKEIASVNAAGVYELKLNGFFRLQRDQAAFDMYNNGEQVSTYAWIYMNDVKSYVKCVFSEAVTNGAFANGDAATEGQYWVDSNTDNWYPNTMTSAVECFDHDMYQVKAYGLVANAGDPLRIGIAGDMTQADGPSGKGANWMMWDNFKLTYVGYDAATIAPILQEALANMPALTEPMGKSVYAKATAAKTAAEAAVYGSDGKAMFNALKDLWDVEAEIENSVALFKKLSAAREELNAMLGQSENADAVDEAGEFVEQLAADIKDHKYEDADVEGLLAKIKGFRYKLRMPAVITEGTDLTDVLETPTYTNANGEASSEGWEGTTAAVNSDVMNAEIFGGTTEPYNLFDHYQEIPGLPEGNYTVTVKAYYRAGDPKPDYEAYTAGTEGCDNVVLYANGVSTKIHRLAEFADGMHAGEDGWAEVAENSGLYVPNTMATAATLFDEQGNALVNKVVAKVGKDGILRLGLKKEVGIEKDWCLFDDWTLTCGGQLSGKPGDVNGDNVVDVADISAIISVMAGSEVNKATADVNGDGEVDVADISATITIMANNARAAKAIEE